MGLVMRRDLFLCGQAGILLVLQRLPLATPVQFSRSAATRQNLGRGHEAPVAGRDHLVRPEGPTQDDQMIISALRAFTETGANRRKKINATRAPPWAQARYGSRTVELPLRPIDDRSLASSSA
jgi:hypothetical protein